MVSRDGVLVQACSDRLQKKKIFRLIKPSPYNIWLLQHNYKLNRMASLQTSTATRLAFINQGAKKTEKVDPVTRLDLVTTRSTTLTNEQSHSGIRAQPTALYIEAATLCSLFYQVLPKSTSPPRTLIT
ncbi:hypothetical protein FHG87_009160 [Trinorchestia longiramus]|nr:hypothetical protein FHG87_009160 [Trinorchestia longiramus]